MPLARCAILAIAYCAARRNCGKIPAMKNVIFLAHTINKHNAIKLDSIYTAAKARGWSVHEAEFGWTAWSTDDIVSTLKPDGIILDGGRLSGDIDLRPLRKIPSVYLDTDFPAPPGNFTIRSDAVAIADMAADELLASEPVEAAFFSLSPLKRWSRLRAARFRERMRGARVPFRVLERASDIGSLRHPAAVFAVNDMAAAALLRHAAECGIQCPRDFTLVSVDNETLFCENASPRVSSIEQNISRVGTAAVEALDSLFGGERTNRQILVPPRRLVRRDSSVRPQAYRTIAQRAAILIDLHAIGGIDIAGVAAMLGCSRRTVETHYRAFYGQSVGEAILARRFAEVERLLLNPDQQIGAVANLCGWKSSTHLMRAFRARYGMTMSEWRSRAAK